MGATNAAWCKFMIQLFCYVLGFSVIDWEFFDESSDCCPWKSREKPYLNPWTMYCSSLYPLSIACSGFTRIGVGRVDVCGVCIGGREVFLWCVMVGAVTARFCTLGGVWSIWGTCVCIGIELLRPCLMVFDAVAIQWGLYKCWLACCGKSLSRVEKI